MLNGALMVPESLPAEQRIDAEKHARSVMHKTLLGMRADLRQHQREDLLAYLIGCLWEIAKTYDPARDRNPNFKSYSAAILPNRVVQWFRDEFVDERYEYGDIEQRDAVAFPASLDAPVGARSDDGDLRLADVVGLHESDDATNGHEDMERLVAERDRFRARDLEVLRRGLSEKSAA